jgi:excisionase family DNA binding protein
MGEAINTRVERLVLTVPEAAEMLGISRTTGYALFASGELPSVRLGRRIVVPRRALDELLDRCSSGGGSRGA